MFSRRSESKGGRSGVVVVESGRVSNLVRQFDEVDGPSQVLYVYIKHVASTPSNTICLITHFINNNSKRP